jgi:Pyruvate/2-oxoacid:ferredoxin oxidoreductase gamma subunit
VEAARWNLERMVEAFPLGVYRDGHDLDLGHPRRRTQPALEGLPALLDLAEQGAGIELAAAPPLGELRVKIAGFGGQGVLFLGALLARAGMLEGRQVCWMPSYGPEMRGGTAHCNVTLSDGEIGSPLIQHPDVLVAMNGPSLERFGADVARGGTILYNASMVERPQPRDGVRAVGVPANELAERLGQPKAANMVALGALLASGLPVSKPAVLAALAAELAGRQEAIESNHRAIEAGMEAVGAMGARSG